MPPVNDRIPTETTSLLHDEAITIQIGNKDPVLTKIAIVGGGVAGIVCARVLKKEGFDLTLYEAGPAVSGVWSQGYPGFAIQTPGALYEFPDKELPPPKDYKSGPEIQAYCEDYCREHKLDDVIHLNTKVTSITGNDKPNGNKQWQLTTMKDGKTSKKLFDFCVLATGIYSPSLKYVPPIEGKEFFRGRICHSEDAASPDSRKGKKVVVVG